MFILRIIHNTSIHSVDKMIFNVTAVGTGTYRPTKHCVLKG
jgi:hypothetical protein